MSTKTVLTYTPDEKRFASKAGFRKKKPTKPKKKTHTNMTNYISRYNSWVKELKEAAKKGREMDKLKEQLRKAK